MCEVCKRGICVRCVRGVYVCGLQQQHQKGLHIPL